MVGFGSVGEVPVRRRILVNDVSYNANPIARFDGRKTNGSTRHRTIRNRVVKNVMRRISTRKNEQRKQVAARSRLCGKPYDGTFGIVLWNVTLCFVFNGAEQPIYGSPRLPFGQLQNHLLNLLHLSSVDSRIAPEYGDCSMLTLMLMHEITQLTISTIWLLISSCADFVWWCLPGKRSHEVIRLQTWIGPGFLPAMTSRFDRGCDGRVGP